MLVGTTSITLVPTIRKKYVGIIIVYLINNNVDGYFSKKLKNSNAITIGM